MNSPCTLTHHPGRLFTHVQSFIVVIIETLPWVVACFLVENHCHRGIILHGKCAAEVFMLSPEEDFGSMGLTLILPCCVITTACSLTAEEESMRLQSWFQI